MVSPDIVSLLVTWDPPANEGSRRFLTEYEISHSLFREGGNLIGRTRVGRSVTSHEIKDLLPGLHFKVRVQAMIGEIGGLPLTINLSTREIGESHDE